MIIQACLHTLADIQAGGTVVDTAAEVYLRNALGKAGLSHEEVSEYTIRGVKDFSATLKNPFTIKPLIA